MGPGCSDRIVATDTQPTEVKSRHDDDITLHPRERGSTRGLPPPVLVPGAPLRIAHVSDFYLPRLGGIETHISDLAARQVAQGHDVHVVTTTAGPAQPGVHRVSGAAGPALNPLAAPAGIRALRRLDVDVVHCHLGVATPLAFFAARAAARSGLPTVVTVHSMWAGVSSIMSAMDALGGWSALPIQWTAVSAAAARPVRPHLRPGTPITLLANGIDQDAWRMPAAPERAAELRLVAVMRLARRKRPLALLRILAAAQEHLDALGDPTRLRLTVAGEGGMRSAMEGYVRRHHLGDSVDLVGRLERREVRRLLGTAHAFVAPADLESFGIAALEARCAGLPVVAKSQGGVREFIGHEREGLLCDTDAEMAAGLVRLVREPSLRQAIADHNRSADCPVAWAPLLAATEEIYRAALLGRSTAATTRSAAGAGRSASPTMSSGLSS